MTEKRDETPETDTNTDTSILPSRPAETKISDMKIDAEPNIRA